MSSSSAQMPAVGQWHTYRIEAGGLKITVRLNGTQVSQLLNANRSPGDFIGLQAHHGGSKVQFTRLRIKDLKPLAIVIQPVKVAARADTKTAAGASTK